MEMTQAYLQSALPQAMLEANKKFQQETQKEEKPLVNLRRAIFDACKIGVQFDTTDMIEALEPFGYKRSTIIATLRTLVDEKALSRSQLAPYAYTKLRMWEQPDESPMKVKATVVKPKPIKLEDMERVPSINPLTDALKVMAESADKVAPGSSFAMHDLTLVIHELDLMAKYCQRTYDARNDVHPDDYELAKAHGDLLNDINEMSKYMLELKSTLLKVHGMAHGLRGMIKDSMQRMSGKPAKA